MATPQKRKSEDVNVSEITLCSAATVHGVFIGEISPVKCGKSHPNVKYFDGQFTDGKKAVRMVSFEPKLRTEVQKAQESGEEVALRNCYVQKSRTEGSDELEIVASSRTRVERSAKKFCIEEEVVQAAASVSGVMDIGSLGEISELAVNQHVNVTGKVQSIQPPGKVFVKTRGEALSLENFILADCTAVCRGTAWDRDVGVLQVGHSYALKNVTIREFNGAKYVSLSDRASMEEVADIGEVVTDDVVEGKGAVTVVKGEIVGVLGCDEYESCRSCKAKVADVSEVVGECSKCGMKAKLGRCAKSVAARVIIEDEEGTEYKVSAFNDVVEEIGGGRIRTLTVIVQDRRHSGSGVIPQLIIHLTRPIQAEDDEVTR